jgi:FkbM family methyltransferase
MLLEHIIYNKFKNKVNGVFMEIGAFDGIIQSNTLLLEAINNWKGILVEPSVCFKEELIIKRPKSIIEMCAISEYDGHINGDFTGQLMSSIDGVRLSEHYKVNKINPPSIQVPCFTLTSICKKHNMFDIDFCSIDVEGNEYSVLKSIDFNLINIKSFCIEVYTPDSNNIINFLQNKGYFVENLSNYSKKTHPTWDGSHQDYFFTKDRL